MMVFSNMGRLIRRTFWNKYQEDGIRNRNQDLS